MKKITTLLCCLISLFSYSQIGGRCAVCPASLNGVTNGWVLTDSSGHAVWKAVSSSGGSVTSVSGLTPLFTTSNPTTTPTFVLSNASAHTFFGDSTGSAGVPAYVHLSTSDLPTGIPNANLANSTISGVALGASLFSHTNGYALSGSSYNGGTSRTWDVDSSKVQNKITLTTTGASGATTLGGGNILNVPTYTLAGLGGLAASEGTYTPTDSLASAGLTIVHAPVSWSRTGNTVTIHGILYLSQTIISPIVDTFQISLPVGTTLGINGAQSGMINSAANVGAALAGGGGIYGNVSKKLTVTISVFATISSLQCFFIAYYSLQ